LPVNAGMAVCFKHIIEASEKHNWIDEMGCLEKK
jgi:hypothetical protein